MGGAYGRGVVCKGFWLRNLRKRVGVGAGWSWLRIITGACGYGEELSGFKNAGNFLSSCRTSFSKRTTPWNMVDNIF